MRFPSVGRSGRLFLSTFVALAGFGLSPLSADAGDLHGRVLDPHDRAVPLADVLVIDGARVVLAAKTSADGRFGPFALAPGRYDLVVSAPGLWSAPRPVTVTAAAARLEIDVRLEISAVRESVVVSAAQVETALSRVPDTVSVVDRTEIVARQVETVADALRSVPGFGVTRSGGRGALTSFFPRGGESDYTLVLVDGIAMNAFGGGFDAGHLGTADVERIEVVRGPQSALLGGGAIGGVVHVTTRLGGPTRAEGRVETGAYGTTRTSATSAGSRGAWMWGASLDWTGSDGDRRPFAPAGGPVANDDYTRTAASMGVGWSDRPDRRVRADVRIARDERGFPGPYGSDPLGFYGGLDRVSRGWNDTRAVGVRAAFGAGPGLRHAVQAAWTDAPSRYASPYGESDDRSRRITGRYQVDVEGRLAGLSAGWEALAERADNTYITGETFAPVPVERTQNGLFLEARWRPDARVVVHAGARVERIARRALEGNPSPFGPRPALADDVVWSANPKVAAAWTVRRSGAGSWTRVRVGAGTGIKPPTAFEIAFTDNPSLKPERSRSVDLGVEHALARGTVVVEAVWFANRYDQLIVAVGSSLAGASRYRTDNIANARARGLELGASWRGPGGLTSRVAWTWLDTAVLDVDDLAGRAPAPFQVGDPLVRRPRHQAAANVGWSGRRATMFVALDGRGAVTDFEPNFASSLHRNPGYVTWTIGASVAVTAGIEVYGRVTNLFDRSYEEALGFPALGRAAVIGLRLARSR